GGVSGSDQGFVFLVGDVADPVEFVFYVPVLAYPGGQGGGVGIGAGDEVDDLDGFLSLCGDGAPELGDLGCAGEFDPGRHGGNLDGAAGPAAVVFRHCGCRGDLGAGQGFQSLVERGRV